MDDRWSGTGGPGTGPGPADPPGYGPGYGHSSQGYGPGYGHGPQGFGPPPPTQPPPPMAPQGSTGRAPDGYIGLYGTTGILLLVFACILGGWITHTAVNANVEADELFWSLVMNDPARYPLLVFTPHEWAFTVALLIVGIATLARRRIARGAALVLAFLLLGAGARQLIGLTGTEYRESMFASDYGVPIVLTYVFAFSAATRVIILMLRAREPNMSPGPVSRGPRAAGVLLIVIGVVEGFWYARSLREFNQSVAPDSGRGAFSQWWHEVLNINAPGGYETSAGFTYYNSALIAAFLIVGVLLLRDAPAARGAALGVLGIAQYIQLRDVFGIQFDRLSDYYQDTTVGWSVTSTFAVLVAMVVCVGLIRYTRRGSLPPPYPPPYPPRLP